MHRRFALVLTALILTGIAISPRAAGNAHAQSVGVTRSYPAGWNLVALPNSTGFAGISGAYTLQPGDSGYETVTPDQQSVNGYGYWAYFGDNATVDLAAGSNDPYSVTTQPGQFLMIGDPSGTSPATVTGADQVYTHDPTNGYQQTTTLLPGQGAWAVSLSGGAITVTPEASASPRPVPAPIAAPEPAPPVAASAQSHTILNMSGSDDQNTATFSVPANWQIRYTYDCSDGGAGFLLVVYNTDGSVADFPAGDANPLGRSGVRGNGTQSYHTGGNYYVNVVGLSCTWSITVTAS